MSKIAPDAFDFYVSLGPERSYRAVAEHYGVSKRAVVKRAAREGWAERLREVELVARAEADRKLTETLADMHGRHRRLLRAMSSRVATALRDYPLNNGMEAVRAAEVVIRLERLLAGDATERTAVSVEQVTKAEIDRLLDVKPCAVAESDDDREDDQDDEDGDDDW
jgi:hypothetical protein